MRRFIGFVLILLIGFFIYANLPQRSAPPSSPASPTATPAPNAPAASAPSSNPRPSGVPETVSQATLDLIKELGRKAGVDVQITGVQGKDVSARFEWMGDVATIGADLIESLMREGIVRDFEDRGGRRWYDQQTRSRWTQDYLLKVR